jgi:hypothetical protein
MTRVNAGIVFAIEKVGMEGGEGLALLVIDPQGRKTGYDPDKKTTYNQIPGQYFKGDAYWPDFVAIPFADDGPYTIKIQRLTDDASRLKAYAGYEDGHLRAVFEHIPQQAGDYTYRYDKGGVFGRRIRGWAARRDLAEYRAG